jgi:hypothetical protein
MQNTKTLGESQGQGKGEIKSCESEMDSECVFVSGNETWSFGHLLITIYALIPNTESVQIQADLHAL